jgi:hypothetical protein
MAGETLVALQVLPPNGINPTSDVPVACDDVNGNYVLNSGKDVFVRLENTDVGSHDVVFEGQEIANRSLTVTQRTVTLLAGENRTIGPFDPAFWNRKTGVESGGFVFTAADALVEVFAFTKA